MRDLTTGTPAKLIFLFTIPLLVGNIFQQFYNMVDMIIVGQTIGKEALAAVGATGSITFLIIGFAQGFDRWIIYHHGATFRRSGFSRCKEKFCCCYYN